MRIAKRLPKNWKMMVRRESLVGCLALLLLTALSACVTAGGQYAQKSAETLAKRTDYLPLDRLTYRTLTIGELIDQEVGEADSVILLDQHEATYAKAFALPQWNEPYMVKIDSHVVGAMHDPAVFYPTVLFLDAGFREVRRSDPSAFTLRRDSFSGNAVLNGTLFVNKSNSEEAYMVIVSQRRHADNARALHSIAVQQTMVMVPVGGGMMMTWMLPGGARESSATMIPAASGRLKLRLENYRPVEMSGKPPK
ncbi:MalM family protein [Ferrovibrio sp.]|uniref:MalM family protein n=1 Tax=Ferrovibrio sp. TaxID=1917215 RepID=UPI0025BBB0B8|nr:MalM family protein [Ferrovibrio sp.]MBX3455488.1 hypothetical protein [Ferrovibrio sp.]